mmetsp:Transcript_45259/g.75507  ORF Transcript_45259/g.75507 Transcript_45259/m.75507 type:complete len:321 (+) Transcript_45259:101-1063(+)|eukprot:CAMPEP_0198210624 /NCGR_PEP_ID=MMETSP1445-20131203/21206_1 /TAXON_ID=36898 /ORGANISM="Pyramimonas sp., Strain CCMP2087" /LENGTH=320 /DNA_ID=CAMNT_0043884731 /DNA_START=58 /DNA_END=1020 /DNA_ORIENTATION=+
MSMAHAGRIKLGVPSYAVVSSRDQRVRTVRSRVVAVHNLHNLHNLPGFGFSKQTQESRALHGGRVVLARASSGMSSNENSNFDEEMAVPFDQRPVNELKNLQTASLYSWGELTDGEYFRKLLGLWIGFFVLIAGPISAQTYPYETQPLQFALAGGCGALVPVVFCTLRIYLGWSYVGDRLLSAVVEYEETGWYDGQIWVKSPEVLSRDRLLGSYKVKPILGRAKNTMLSCAAVLALSSSLFGGVLSLEPEEAKLQRAPVPRITSEGLVYRSSSSSTSEYGTNALKADDNAAAAEAAAAGGRPGYCGDRYYKALAGGNGCN